jgi:hypothetical protein
MKQVDSYIIHIKSDVIAHQNDPGKVTHDARFQQLANEASTSATETIPPEVLKGSARGRTVTVTPQTMATLQYAKQIADVTKRILKEGSPNQELDLVRTSGRNNMVANYGRLVMPRPPGTTVAAGIEEHAINSAIAGAGRCGDYGRVAYVLAQLLNLPANLVADPANDHTYVLLEPESDTPVKCDPWSVIATVCLASESDFPDHVTEARFRVGDQQPNRFNLTSIEEIRQRLEQKLGPDAIASAAVEQERKNYGFSSKLLDKYLLQQGLMRYDKISTEGMSEKEKTEVKAEQARMVKLVQEEQLKSAARETHASSKTISTSKPRVTEAKDTTIGKDALKAHKKQAVQEAKKAAEDKALTKVQTAAVDFARKKGLLRPEEAFVREVTASATKSAGTVTATVEVKALGRVEPGLWDSRLTTSALNTYKSSQDGSSVCFNKISPNQLKQIQSAMSKGKKLNFPEAYIKASDTGGHRKSASMSSARASASGSGSLPSHRRAASEATADANAAVTKMQKPFLDATVKKINGLLKDLSALRQDSADHAGDPHAQVFARQKAIVKMLGDRIEHLSNEQLSATLRRLADELPSLRHGAREEAIELLEVWVVNVPDDQSSIDGAISDARSNSSNDATDNSGSEQGGANVDDEANSPPPVIVEDVEDVEDVEIVEDLEEVEEASETDDPFVNRNPGEIADELGLLLGDLDNLEQDQLPELRRLLDSGLARLVVEDDNLFQNVVYELQQQWVRRYGATGVGDVLNAIAEQYLMPGDLVRALSAALPNYADPAIRERAIGEIGRHLANIPSNTDALHGAARMIGQAIQLLNDVDQQLALMRILDSRVNDVSELVEQDLINMLEHAANGDDRLMAQFNYMFPEDEN